MATRRPASRVVLILFLLGFFCAGLTKNMAQTNKINIDVLTSETQKSSPDADKMILVWWIPEEYWQASLSQDPTISAAQLTEFVKVLKPYNVFVIVDGKIGTFGGVTYKPEEEIRKSIELVDREGNKYSPLYEARVDPDTKNLLSMMKPVLANILEPVGENMHFYLFPQMNKAGKPIIEAKKEGGFTLKLGGSDFKWKLPIGSLLPPKVCPIDGEELNGAWKYCPWHGEVLKLKSL
jgi:hypothetical protein